MANGEDPKSTPNLGAIEVRYKPNARVIDKRGEWAELLSSHLSLSQWALSENQLDVYDDPQTTRAYIGFNRCGLMAFDADVSRLIHLAKRFLNQTFEFPGFGNPIEVKRIGVRWRICTKFDDSLDVLTSRITDRVVDLRTAGLNAIGLQRSQLSDIGAAFVFRDDSGEFNIQLGPMTREEMRDKKVLAHRKEADLPEVGLYYDVDHYVKPNAQLQLDQVLARIELFAREGWNRHGRLRRTIVEP